MLLSIRRNRTKPLRRPKRFQKSNIDLKLVKFARDSLLSAAHSTYVDRETINAMLDGTQIQMALRERARYVDMNKSDDDAFMRAVRALPHSEYVSLSEQEQVANQLRCFHNSVLSSSSADPDVSFPRVASLTRHLSRYRSKVSFSLQNNSSRHCSTLLKDLRAVATKAVLSKDALAVGIKAVAASFETKDKLLRTGGSLKLFGELLNGQEATLWSAILDANWGNSRIQAPTELKIKSGEWINQVVSELGGSQVVCANPALLIASQKLTSDEFIRASVALSCEERGFGDVVEVFEAACIRTAVRDCRGVLEVIWKQGGLKWLKTTDVDDMARILGTSLDEAYRLQVFANGFVRGSNFPSEEIKRLVDQEFDVVDEETETIV